MISLPKKRQKAAGIFGTCKGMVPKEPFSSPSPFSFLLVGGALARENEGPFVFSCQGPAD